MHDAGSPIEALRRRPTEQDDARRRLRALIRPRREWARAVAPLGAVGLGLWDIGRPSMGGTEAITYWAAHLPVHTLLHLLRHVDVVHGSYYALMHVVFAVFGSSTVVLRLPSVLAGAAAVALCAALARRLTGSDAVAFLCSGVLLALPVVAQYSQLGRSYAIVTSLVAAATLLLLRCVDRPESGLRWWAYTVVMVVVVYLHEFSMLVLAAHAATLVWSRVGRRTIVRWSVRAALTVLVAVPLILVSKNQSGQVSYLKRPTLIGMRTLVLDYTGPRTAVAVVIVALMLITVVGALRRGESGITLTRVAFPLLVLPPALLIGESLIGTPLYAGIRYVLFGTLGVGLLAGAGLATVISWAVDRLHAPRRGARLITTVVGVVAVAGLFLAQLPAQRAVHSVRSESQDLLAGADYLQAHARPGDGVLYVPRSLSSMALVYPHDVAALDDVAQQSTPERSGTLYGSRAPLATITRRLAAVSRLWVAQRPHLRLIPLYVALIDRAHLRRRSRHSVTGIVLTLYERTTTPAG